MQTYEIPQNCPFSLPFPTVIAFHRVKKSPLITGIVDRIKINSEQSLPFSESELFRYVYISIGNMYGSDGVKGEPSPTCLRKYPEEDEGEAVA